MKLWTHDANWQIIILCSCLVKLAAFADDPQKDIDELQSKPTDNIASLNEEKCLKNRKGCCSEKYLDDYTSQMKCIALHESKIPKDGEKNPAKVIQFCSYFAECYYKERKYIGKGDKINMEMVKKNAEKMFHDRPREKEFHIELFEFCRKEAAITYKKMKTSPASKFILGLACKPFFLYVMLCQVNYHQKYSCPYFMWYGNKDTPAVAECNKARHKCYEIDGLHPPTEPKSN